jgi:preprotein translocase subunit SecG
MKAISSVLPYVQIFLSIVLIASVLLQQTGAAMGGAFGGNDAFSSAHHTRRGLEKTLFIITIVVGILFALSALINLIY